MRQKGGAAASMSIRNFKQLFSVVFAIILGGILFGIGLLVKNSVEEPAPHLGAWYHPALIILKELNDSYPFYLKYTLVALGILGVLVGVFVGPPLAQAIVNAGNAIERMSTRDKMAVGCGTALGGIITLPFVVLLMRLPPIIGIPLCVLIGVAFVYLGIRAGVSMKDEFRFIAPAGSASASGEAEVSMDRCKILDTNVIIDGRIADICKTSFLEGPIYVPGFVLDELQHIADSSDSLKRARGRRGLDILNAMQKEFPLVVRIHDDKAGPVGNTGDGVDTRLVALAKAMNGAIVTNDFNLNKVARLQGVTVLNVNDLAMALKPVVLPGEEMHVNIIREGKEPNQGVAYLEDGTMIVVEEGRRYIGEAVEVVVSSVLQTVAGKMIFARVKGTNGESEDTGDGGRGRTGGGPRVKVR